MHKFGGRGRSLPQLAAEAWDVLADGAGLHNTGDLQGSHSLPSSRSKPALTPPRVGAAGTPGSAAPQLRPRVPAPPHPPPPVTAARAAHSSGTLAPGVPVDVGGARPWGARARAAPPGGRGRRGIPGPEPPSAAARGSVAAARAHARAHTCTQRAPRPPLPWGRAATRGTRGRARPLPQPPRAPHPPLIVSLRNASAQRKDNGTPGRRGWGAPGLARSLTSRGRRRR